MKITSRTAQVIRTEAIEIEGGEVRPVSFSRDGKRYRVDLVVAEWSSDDGGETWREGKVGLHGQVLKLDGSDSKSRTDERMWRGHPRPDWLTELVADTDPTEAAR